MPSFRRNRHQMKSAERSTTRWMLTYSDMMTLLLCFFVMLYSFSSVDAAKFEQFLISLKSTFSGILPGGETISDEAYMGGQRKQLEEIYREASAYVDKAGLTGKISVLFEERGLVIRFMDSVYFELGDIHLKPESEAVLDTVAPFLQEIDNPIRVEGFACDLPIHTLRFPSNWELSTARATTVVRYLIDEHGINPARLSATGYGKFRPLVPNTSEENRKKNRRVDLVIMYAGSR